ncbi:MAG: right-handed parallel beta-helix repeat-containing protein [Verrucomicrobiia bacterium]
MKVRQIDAIREINMRLLFVLPLVALLLAATHLASAAEYCVDPKGDDANTGTESQPWKTLQKAADTLVAGDTVHIKAGTYHERVIPKNSGSPGKRITYAAFPGHEVTVDGQGIAFGWGSGLFHIKDKSGITVSGLRIVNSAYYGVSISGNASHITIEKNFLRGCQSSGIHVWSHRRATTIRHIVIADNEVTETNMKGDQEGISVCGADAFEVRGNHVHHIHKEGIDAKEGCSNGKILKNYVHHMLGFRQPSGAVVCTVGVYVDTYGDTRNIEVSGNIVHNCGSGFAIASEDGQPSENVSFVNNIAYNNQDGFVVAPWGKGGPLKNIALMNNVAFANRRKGIFVQHTNIEKVVVRNNICSQNTEAQIVVNDPIQQGVTLDHNLVDGFRNYKMTWKKEKWQEVRGDDVVTGNPRFVNPIGGDFHLNKDSPAIDKGSPVGAPGVDHEGNHRPEGPCINIGAYENK